MIPQNMIDMLNSGIRYAKAMTSMEDIIRKLDLIELAHEEMSRENFIVEFEEGGLNYDHRAD